MLVETYYQGSFQKLKKLCKLKIVFCLLLGVTAAYLQLPVFGMNYPNYLNFGGIGYAVGHEMTHGFDNEGHNWDKNGRWVEAWSSKTQNEFSNRTNCLVEQYSNYSFLDSNVS